MQHEALNQKEWLALEDHVLGSAKALGQKMTVLTGPIFHDDDPKFDNKGAVKPPTQIPMQFYKVVVWNDKKDGLKAAAFVLSQEDLVNRDRSLFKGEFNPGRFDVYQVPLQELEDMTQMKFGPLGNVTNEPRLIDLDRGILPLV
jgi:endonuclease G